MRPPRSLHLLPRSLAPKGETRYIGATKGTGRVHNIIEAAGERYAVKVPSRRPDGSDTEGLTVLI